MIKGAPTHTSTLLTAFHSLFWKEKKNADAFCPIQLIVYCSRSFSFRSPLEDISRCRTTYLYNVLTMWVMFRNDGVGSGLAMELV